MTILTFTLGLFVGCFLGVFILSLMIMARDNSNQTKERWIKWMTN